MVATYGQIQLFSFWVTLHARMSKFSASFKTCSISSRVLSQSSMFEQSKSMDGNIWGKFNKNKTCLYFLTTLRPLNQYFVCKQTIHFATYSVDLNNKHMINGNIWITNLLVQFSNVQHTNGILNIFLNLVQCSNGIWIPVHSAIRLECHTSTINRSPI